ncbi:DUF6378 domain-containing protein [Paracidovorax wautersii]|uniref:DUF6378 domain-containing protein n=1 Tax=Paracidovorax wautersii TaxID=1177982 RepID=A0A1I2E6U0_9BURK|nr:DUF6378 domain-containing protein [Paracidovorax wautersii]SFE88201.1 hypothetical protein SAMN04489711_106246 [Paracidovorax wautersii]
MPAAVPSKRQARIATQLNQLNQRAAQLGTPVISAATSTEAGRPVTAHDVLTAASATINQRGAQRDSTQGAQQERSMAATVAAFNAIEGTTLTERQGWAFMQTLKLVRAAACDRNGNFNPDDALDGAAYAALGGEAAAAAAGMTVQP